MTKQIFNETDFANRLKEQNARIFLNMISTLEKTTAQNMLAHGYKRINEKERTVIFSFGQMTYSRSRWKKGSDIRIPVDEHLGIEPHSRYSCEFIYQLVELASIMPYRKVVKVVELLQKVYISKNIVQKALTIAGKRLAEQEEYHSLSAAKVDDSTEKIKSPIVFIEGDSVWIKHSSRKNFVEVNHFIVHTGVKKGKRHALNNKFEMVSTYYQKAKRHLMDILVSRFDLSDTIFISNSDGGKGYSPQIFKDIANAFQPKQHIHFWDAYHVNQLLLKLLAPFPKELMQQAFRAIREQNNMQLKAVLETAASLIEPGEKQEEFERIEKQLLTNFNYTARPSNYGLSSSGIGIIESNHRKITYRMKKRGMYWSRHGAETMSRIIILSDSGELKDLFLGEWRQDYMLLHNRDKRSSFDYSIFPNYSKKGTSGVPINNGGFVIH